MSEVDRWQHDHVFDRGNAAGERGTRAVAWLTAGMMVVEIVAGWWFNSMALLADGFHMSSHALAIGLSAIAYRAARRYAGDPRFAFGTWKIEILGGFASAVLLLAVVALMVVGSLERFLSPQPIHYREAMLVAVVGLVVNVVSALLLGHAHEDHGHDHGHPHDHGHADKNEHGHAHDHDDDRPHAGDDAGPVQHHDLNLRSAYVHVIADAATSVLAIAALAGGWLFGWAWLDPLMGIVGAVLVAVWARNLLRDTGSVLLDREMDHPVVEEIREVIQARSGDRGTRIADLHVWRVGRASYSCAVSLVSRDPALTSDTVRDWIAIHPEVVHSTIEINHVP